MTKTPEELNAENVNEYDIALYDAIQKRKFLYPPIEDQLDMLWHGMNNNTEIRIEPFYSAIKQIKDSHPKPQKEN